MAFLVESQISVAKEMLPEKYAEHILAACNEEISTYVSNIMLHIGMSWQTLGTSRFCALINDASRLSDILESHNENYLSNAKFEEEGDQMIRDLAELSLHATNYLCERIALDLREPDPILIKVGDFDWELDEEGTAVTRTVATLEDFFGDLETWLYPGYYFPKVLKKCFDMTLQTYVESFFANTIAGGITNASSVSSRLGHDYAELLTFFNDGFFEQYYGQAGFYSVQDVNWRLRILQSLRRMIDPSTVPDELEDDMIAVLKQFDCGQDGAPTILHLAGLRKRYAGAESIDWLRAIVNADKAIQHGAPRKQDGGEIFYRLPDIRNSNYIRNIRVNKNELQRSLASDVLPHALAISEILDTQSAASRMGKRFSIGVRRQSIV